MALEKSRHEFCAAPMLFAPRMFRLWAGGDASSIAADSNKKDIEDGEGAAALDDEDGIIPTVMVQKKGLRDKSTPVRGRRRHKSTMPTLGSNKLRRRSELRTGLEHARLVGNDEKVDVETRLANLESEISALKWQLTWNKSLKEQPTFLPNEDGGVRLEVPETETALESVTHEAPPLPPPHKTSESGQHHVELLQWRNDYREWLTTSDDASSISVEIHERDLLEVVVNSIEEPSLYLLASTPGTFNLRKMLMEKDTGDNENATGTCCHCSGGRRLRAVSTHAAVMAALLSLLTFITIILPIAMLANLYKRNIDWSDFTVDGVSETSKLKRQRHKAYLKILSAALLFYLLYTSLNVLQDVKVFRFFLLGALPTQVAAAHESKIASVHGTAATNEEVCQSALKPTCDKGGSGRVSENFDKQATRRPGRLSCFWRISANWTRYIIKVSKDLIFLKDNLVRPFLILGMVSKVTSLVCIYQLTYLTFRTGFTATSMVLNSLALNFILDTDRALTASLRSTLSMRRYFANAVLQLRAEAEVIVATPGLVRSISEPATLRSHDLLRKSLSNTLLRRIAASYPRIRRWLAFEKSSKEKDARDNSNVNLYADPLQWQREMQFRRCCRSEIGHRLLVKFIYVYGGLIVILQVAGNAMCSSGFSC